MVTATPGGAANKAGNRYEHLWVVLRIAELLRGDNSRIRLDPFGRAGTGIELELDIEGVAWGEQAKSSTSNWTVKRLVREGVLQAAKFQIDSGRHFRLVVASSADALNTLAYRARKSESLDDFTESLEEARRKQLTEVAGALNSTQEKAWHFLRNVEVEHLSEDALERIVARELELLFAGDTDLIAGELRNFCEEYIHENITAPQVFAHLESKGFIRRLLLGDANAISEIRGTRERHQSRVASVEPRIGLVSRDEAKSLNDVLRNPEGAQIVVLDGRAGSGKSTVASAVAACLEEEGWFVAVARMDVDRSMVTSKDLGKANGLSDSPSAILAGISGDSPALLVVDQLDAVSIHGGRMPNNFDAVAEVITEIRRSPNVKILLVARTVDIEGDPRLRSLLHTTDGAIRHTLGDLDGEAVKKQIIDHGLELPTSETTLELLRTPLHLSVFCRLSETARTHEYTTLQDIYTRYTAEVRSSVESRVRHLDWDKTAGALVRHMSENETLQAPEEVLDRAANREKETLISESVIVRDGGKIAFFHESYFDYLFARSFVAAGRDIRDFLVESGQYLFRRAQMRQVLEYLAATDRRRFRQVVVQLLGVDDIRFHLKTVVVSVLRHVQPTPEDWEALEELAWSGSPVSSRLLLLLNVPGWFDAVDSIGRWEEWLADPKRSEQAFYPLSLVARSRGARVAELVWPHIGECEDWRRRLHSMVSWALNRELVDLAVELVERGEFDDAFNQFTAGRDFWSILRSLKNEDPAGSARLIGAVLHRSLACAKETGSSDPFESGHLARNSQSAPTISEVAVAAPEDFVEHVLPFIMEVAFADQYPRKGCLPGSRRWGNTEWSHAYTVDDVIIDAVEGSSTACRRKPREMFGSPSPHSFRRELGTQVPSLPSAQSQTRPRRCDRLDYL